MNYRILGKTGIRVSEIGLGCEGFASMTQQQTREAVDYALANGVNFIEIYASEPSLREKLGDAFSRHKREQYVIQGHIGSVWQAGQYKRSRRLDECREGFEQFLRLMKTDYADLGCIHYCDDGADYESVLSGGLFEYARELKAAGKIRAVALSTHNTDIAKRAVSDGLAEVILFSINPAYDMLPACDDVELFFDKSTYNRTYEGIDPAREELYRLCERQGVALTVMKAYAGGLLLSAQASPFGGALTPVQCLHYCLTRPAVASVAVGAHSIEELAQAIHYCEATDAERDFGAVIASAPDTRFRKKCVYCGHCAPCPRKIDIAAVNKLLDLASSQSSVPETVSGHYDLLAHHAGECVKCGSCVKNCPFGVDIISKMNQAAQLFGK